jgi:hypothetical protein
VLLNQPTAYHLASRPPPPPQATDIVWKLLVCIMLFTLANFLKSFVTKLLSTHFYRTAHFRKVKDAM